MRTPWLKTFRDWRAAARGAPAVRRSIDYHCHLLPGVDDGMASFADARKAILALGALGFRGAVLTPHVYRDMFDNNSAQLREAFDKFSGALAAEGIRFSLFLSAEYFTDENFLNLIEKDDLLSLQVRSERWVLLEFPSMQESPFWDVCLSALAARGYRPVIAHVERYGYVAREPDVWLERFAETGALLQADIGSLSGQYGAAVQRFAYTLLDRDAVKIWGTDVHRPAQIARFIEPGLAKLAAAFPVNSVLDALLPPAANA